MAKQEARALEHLRRSGQLDAEPDPVKLAEGSLTVSPPAKPFPLVDLDAEIRRVLSESEVSLEPPALAGRIRVDAQLVQEALRRLESAGEVANIGCAEVPMYTWCVGAGASDTELRAAVLRLISDMPLTVDALQRATGATLSRVQSILEAIQRDPAIAPRLMDMSADHTGAWFLPPLDPDRPTAADWLADGDV